MTGGAMLATVLEYLASASLLIAAVQAYLIVNKLWSRKHDRKVAEAQSIASNLLGLFTGSPWVVKFALDGEIKQALVSAIWLILTVFFTLVALGVWVPSDDRPGPWARLKRALRLEGQEAGELARAFFRPREADLVLEILRQVALIDRHLDPREREFIDAFARSWGVGSPFDGPLVGQETEGYVALRGRVEAYLSARPPHAQAVQLREVLAALTRADREVSAQESLVMQEITGMIDGYITKDGGGAAFQVVIVPQSNEQDDAIRSLLRQAERISFRGGSAYLAGRFYSADYAHMIRDKYRALGFFTVSDDEVAG